MSPVVVTPNSHLYVLLLMYGDQAGLPAPDMQDVKGVLQTNMLVCLVGWWSFVDE